MIIQKIEIEEVFFSTDTGGDFLTGRNFDLEVGLLFVDITLFCASHKKILYYLHWIWHVHRVCPICTDLKHTDTILLAGCHATLRRELLKKSEELKLFN